MRWLLGTTLALLLLLVLEWRTGWPLYWSLAGLSGDDTAYDLLSANLEKYLQFYAHKCDDGVCLTHEDWACGFTINSSKFSSEQFY